MNDNDLLVILEDDVCEQLTDSYSKSVLKRWRGQAYTVSGFCNSDGRFHSLEVKAESNVEAKNEFISQMKRQNRTGWEHVKVSKS